jgi:hypothetical protein
MVSKMLGSFCPGDDEVLLLIGGFTFILVRA